MTGHLLSLSVECVAAGVGETWARCCLHSWTQVSVWVSVTRSAEASPPPDLPLTRPCLIALLRAAGRVRATNVPLDRLEETVSCSGLSFGLGTHSLHPESGEGQLVDLLQRAGSHRAHPGAYRKALQADTTSTSQKWVPCNPQVWGPDVKPPLSVLTSCVQLLGAAAG